MHLGKTEILLGQIFYWFFITAVLYVCVIQKFCFFAEKQTMHSRKTHVMISVSSASWLDKQDHLYKRLLIDLSRSFMIFFYKLFCLIIRFTCVELYPFKYLWHFDDLGIISRSQQYGPTESVYSQSPASQNSFTLHNVVLLFVWRKSQKLCFFDNLGMYLWR